MTPGLVITQAQADALLARDLNRFETGVTRLAQVPLNQNQFDALVSFSYNLGLGSLQNSTLLRLLNQRDYAGAAAQFPRWNKAGGKVLPASPAARAGAVSAAGLSRRSAPWKKPKLKTLGLFTERG